MQYLIAFLEGIITFISPCLLPMLPLYVSYFAGGRKDGKSALRCSLGFVAGFTTVFVLLGALAGSIGGFLREYRQIVDLVSGTVVMLFGLNFLGVFNLNIFGGFQKKFDADNMNFFSAMLFGVVFSLGWTPCVGAFLGSALLLASQQGHVMEGMLMLLAYSMGLGIPFIISAMLLDTLKGTFTWIKSNYGVINTISGLFLLLMGLLMATGMWGRLLALLS